MEFSADRRTIYISLEEGGAGDQDGVANGVIVAILQDWVMTFNQSTADHRWALQQVPALSVALFTVSMNKWFAT